MWWCGPQARSAFLCIKWCHLLTKRPIFSWARAEPALAKRVSWQGARAKKTPFFAQQHPSLFSIEITAILKTNLGHQKVVIQVWMKVLDPISVVFLRHYTSCVIGRAGWYTAAAKLALKRADLGTWADGSSRLGRHFSLLENRIGECKTPKISRCAASIRGPRAAGPGGGQPRSGTPSRTHTPVTPQAPVPTQ